MGNSASPSNASDVSKAPPSGKQRGQPPIPLDPAGSAARQTWRFRMRPDDDGGPQNWWFASTAIPLLAATFGPLANVMSIAALITSWRNDYDPDHPGVDALSTGFPDPHWCIALNAASLVCGFVGNVFLLFNFTRRVRYIVALPATITLWYLATGIVSAIHVSLSTITRSVRNLGGLLNQVSFSPSPVACDPGVKILVSRFTLN